MSVPPSEGTQEPTPETSEVADAENQKVFIKQSDGVVVLGARGSGKTTLLKFLMKLLKYRYFILDTLGQFTEFAEKPNKYFEVNPADTEAVNEVLSEAVNEGNYMLVVDEIDRFYQFKGTILNDIINVGRNLNIGYLTASRRPAAIHKDVLSNAEYAFVFQFIYPNDLNVLVRWFGVPEETFRNLQKHEFLVFHRNELIYKGKLDIETQETAPPSEIAKAPKREEYKTTLKLVPFGVPRYFTSSWDLSPAKFTAKLTVADTPYMDATLLNEMVKVDSDVKSLVKEYEDYIANFILNPAHFKHGFNIEQTIENLNELRIRAGQLLDIMRTLYYQIERLPPDYLERLYQEGLPGVITPEQLSAHIGLVEDLITKITTRINQFTSLR